MAEKTFTQYEALKKDPIFLSFNEFACQHPSGSFFQSGNFFQLCEQVAEFKPVLFVALGNDGKIAGTLLSLFQVNGSGWKAWLSRRLITWGGPLVAAGSMEAQQENASRLLEAAKRFARHRAIYMEFRNLYDTSGFRDVFEKAGFDYEPRLSYVLRTDNEQEVNRRLSRNRKRQIKSSLSVGAEVAEAESEEEVIAFYRLLKQLYVEKVRKPLAGPDLFLRFWRSTAGKFFVIKFNGEVVGGNVCPVFGNRTVYEWYRCGKDNLAKGLYPNVMATWAPIKFAAKNGFQHFDFMGAGRPGVRYGVRDFKARFGGEEVCFGRYSMALNKPLYRVGKWGMKIYQKVR